VSAKTEGLARSVQVKLARHAREIGADANLVLTRYAIERFLYRLSISPHHDRFILKGGLLMLAWLGETFRATRDADLLGFGDVSDDALRLVVQDVCGVRTEPDAVEFDPATVSVSPIRVEDAYGGVVAEKLHAMVVLGSKNSRMRDFFDVDGLALRSAFAGQTLADAIKATFERRTTRLPERLPIALTREFAREPEKQVQWSAFAKRIGAPRDVGSLEGTVARLAAFLEPVIVALAGSKAFDSSWPPGGPWSSK
jgi:hypothetical protein